MFWGQVTSDKNYTSIAAFPPFPHITSDITGNAGVLNRNHYFLVLMEDCKCRKNCYLHYWNTGNKLLNINVIWLGGKKLEKKGKGIILQNATQLIQIWKESQSDHCWMDVFFFLTLTFWNFTPVNFISWAICRGWIIDILKLQQEKLEVIWEDNRGLQKIGMVYIIGMVSRSSNPR